MAASSEVTIEAATKDSAPVLANLLQFYLHDMSEFFPIEVGADGRFEYPRLPVYWSDAGTYFAFLIRVGSRLAGFALVTRGSPATTDPQDLDLAEFFVLRSYRRSGVGRRAAGALWDRLPGHWVVRVSENNPGALPFWEATVRDYTGGAFATKAHPGKRNLFRVFSFQAGDRISRHQHG